MQKIAEQYLPPPVLAFCSVFAIRLSFIVLMVWFLRGVLYMFLEGAF
jgi:hypothetical protein